VGESAAVELSLDDIREVVAFAAACSRADLADLRGLALERSPSSRGHRRRPCCPARRRCCLSPSLDSPHQVKHILGSAVHLELTDSKAVAKQIEWIHTQADATLRSVLRRFPQPVSGRTTFGKLLAQLGSELRR